MYGNKYSFFPEIIEISTALSLCNLCILIPIFKHDFTCSRIESIQEKERETERETDR